MRGRNFGMSMMMMGGALFLSGGMALAEDLPPLPEVPAEYADKKMPAGGWTDPKAIEEGEQIYKGDVNPNVNCGSCHGKDGTPVKKGARAVVEEIKGRRHAFQVRRNHRRLSPTVRQ